MVIPSFRCPDRVQTSSQSLVSKGLAMEFRVQRSIQTLGKKRGGSGTGSLSDLRRDTYLSTARCSSHAQGPCLLQLSLWRAQVLSHGLAVQARNQGGSPAAALPVVTGSHYYPHL